jgi:site-specific recombinase XerD
MGRLMSAIETAPLPLFDTLEHLSSHEDISFKHPDDYIKAKQFLYSYRGSEATYNAYRRELERLLHWSASVVMKPLNKLQRSDIETFIAFCQKPPPAWIGKKNIARFHHKDGKRQANAKWRPFVVTLSKTARQSGIESHIKNYQLSQKTLQAVFAILSSFYNYLIQEEYLEHNPVAQIRQKSKYFRKQQSAPVIRRLSELQWSYTIETCEKLAEKAPNQHERSLFIMNALYSMYLRVSELSASQRWQPQMGHFYKDHDNNWWFTTVGKGNKQRNIAVCDAMLEALKRYRKHLGLTPLPYKGETTPLIAKQKGPGSITSTRQIRHIVQYCFDRSVEAMLDDGMEEEAQEIQAATVHWLRHTGISDDVKHRPREHVRDDAGHGSSAITDQYVDVEMRERHASNKKKTIKPIE